MVQKVSALDPVAPVARRLSVQLFGRATVEVVMTPGELATIGCPAVDETVLVAFDENGWHVVKRGPHGRATRP
ncbi:MAG TPA: hypothetical protein VGF45_21300 [Polyangia bacterium]